MSQTKKNSFIEACINTAIGLGISMIAAPFIYTFTEMKYTTSQVVTSTALFTAISVARGYFVRRWFNRNEKGEFPILVLIKSIRNKFVIQRTIPASFEVNHIARQYLNLSPEEKNSLEGRKLREQWQSELDKLSKNQKTSFGKIKDNINNLE